MHYFFNFVKECRRGFTSQSEKDAGAFRSRDLRAIAKQTRRGFTLIEMMVAVSMFAIVMMIGVGALLSLVETNKRAQSIHQVMSSLSAALEGMSRSIRVGSTYHCETSISPMPQSAVLAVTKDCGASTGGVMLAIEASSGDRTNQDDQVVFRLNETKLERSLEGGAFDSWVDLTSPEVTIDQFNFYVIGSASGDGIQPRVVMSLQGTIDLPRGATTFHVQSTVVQRLIDL